MFNIACKDIEKILRDYQIPAKINGFSELQRYHYESDDPNSKEVRLIVKVDLEDAAPLVMRFKNEKDVTIELIESQSQFADVLKKNGIITPEQYQAIFVARLMDYPENREENFEDKILKAFWDGYCSLRSFSKEEQQWYSYLYAVIDAFWSADICWNEDGLLKAQESGASKRVQWWLETIWKRLEALDKKV